MTTLTIDDQLDEFERLQAAAAARRQAQAEEAARARYLAEQAEKQRTVDEAKERLRAILDEYCDLVRSLETMPLNPDAWRRLHMLSVAGNRTIRAITGEAMFTFTPPAGGGFIKTIFARWGLECSNSAERETYNANIKPLSASLNIRRLRDDVEGILDW